MVRELGKVSTVTHTVPLSTVWDPVAAGPGRTPMPGNNSGHRTSMMMMIFYLFLQKQNLGAKLHIYL